MDRVFLTGALTVDRVLKDLHTRGFCLHGLGEDFVCTSYDI